MPSIKVVKSIEIPDDVTVKVERRVITVEGKMGTITRNFSHVPISIRLGDKQVLVKANWPRKREAAIVGTISSHIQNMIVGVRRGFTYKLKIVFSHFPISLKTKGKTVVIENFTGERSPRIAKILGETKVFLKEEDVIVQGIDIEEVSQTAANIERATRIRKKDPRVFLDGIFVYERHEGIEES